MNLAERFRAALRRRQPGTTLVRVGTSRALPPPARPLRALPAPPRPLPLHPVCPYCGQRHAGLPRYPLGRATVITARPGRPDPASQGDERALLRDQASVWREG